MFHTQAANESQPYYTNGKQIARVQLEGVIAMHSLLPYQQESEGNVCQPWQRILII